MLCGSAAGCGPRSRALLPLVPLQPHHSAHARGNPCSRPCFTSLTSQAINKAVTCSRNHSGYRSAYRQAGQAKAFADVMVHYLAALIEIGMLPCFYKEGLCSSSQRRLPHRVLPWLPIISTILCNRSRFGVFVQHPSKAAPVSSGSMYLARLGAGCTLRDEGQAQNVHFCTVKTNCMFYLQFFDGLVSCDGGALLFSLSPSRDILLRP